MYSYKQDGDEYVFLIEDEELETPMGQIVSTKNKNIADRLLKDLKVYGEDPSDPESIVAFQYAMLDFFQKEPRSELEYNIAIGLEPESDWTLTCQAPDPNVMMEWWGAFGKYPQQAESAVKWLKTLTDQQLCAVCVIGRAVESVNIPFILATKLTRNNKNKVIKFIDKVYPYIGINALKKYFDNFLFYFNA
jgi:hypothetical protein